LILLNLRIFIDSSMFSLCPFSYIFCSRITTDSHRRFVFVYSQDIRKFLDGIYVSEKGNIVKDE
jgi:hypothetical protein